MKLFKFIINILLILIFLAGVGSIAMLIRGIQPYIVVSGSMEPEIPTGSLCLIDKKVPYNQISTGMIIAFFDESGTMITHRVNRKTNEGLYTKGDANKVEDRSIVTSSNYIGRNIRYFPKVGFTIEKIRSGSGKYVIICCVAAVLLLGIVVNSKPREKTNFTIGSY